MKHLIPGKDRNIALILTCVLAMLLWPLSTLSAQLSPRVEKAFDEYNQEILKVYQVAESEDPTVAVRRIDEMIPALDRKARALAELVESDPEVMELLESDESYMLFAEKSYFKEIMRIMQNEDFMNKLESSSALQAKIEEAEGIIEKYDSSAQPEEVERETGNAFSLNIQGGDFEGVYQIVTDFEQGAVAYIDDLGYLRIDIMGSAGGNESTISFFVDNTGTGRQAWATDGHFMLEMMDPEGELIFTLWGSEDMGYFDITSENGPGSLVKGTIQGTCSLGDGESEEMVRISAQFSVKYIEMDY